MSAGEKDTLLCSTSTIETGVMGLSETASTGHVRATRASNASSERGGSVLCSVFRTCNEIEWLEGEKEGEEEEEKLEGAESNISCFFSFLLCPPCWHWDKMSNLACLHKWVAGAYGLKSEHSLRRRLLPRTALLGNSAAEREMASGNGLK